MTAAAADELGEKWPDIRDFARGEFKEFAAVIVLIGRLRPAIRCFPNEPDSSRDAEECHQNRFSDR